MTRYRWDRALHRILCKILAPFDFRKVRPLCFSRKMEHCGHILNFGGRVQNESFKFTCMVGVRFPNIESRLRPDASIESYPTVVTPFHFLYEAGDYFEWEASEPDQLEGVANRAVGEILAVADPFFERFSNLDNVEQVLKSSDAFRTFAISPYQRTAVLAATALCKGHPTEARAILSDAMSAPINQEPGKRSRLEELRQQLFPE